MGLAYEYFTYNGKSSRDFDVCISGEGTFISPRRDVTSVAVPGRDGDLHIDNGRFSNIQFRYPAFIVQDFRHNFDAFKAYMSSQRGYQKLEDSYHPEYYRRAAYIEGLSAKMSPLNRAGSFDIVFDCDPRRFLKSGDKSRSMTNGQTIKNPTLYDAKPLIRVTGYGTLTVTTISVVIASGASYTDIDCENEEAYSGLTSRNAAITLSDGKFPVLRPGVNPITYSGNISGVTIIPHWWTV